MSKKMSIAEKKEIIAENLVAGGYFKRVVFYSNGELSAYSHPDDDSAGGFHSDIKTEMQRIREEAKEAKAAAGWALVNHF